MSEIKKPAPIKTDANLKATPPSDTNVNAGLRAPAKETDKNTNFFQNIRRGSLKGQKQKKRIANIVTYILLILVSVVLILPLVWMVSTSLKPIAEVTRFPPDIIAGGSFMGKLFNYG